MNVPFSVKKTEKGVKKMECKKETNKSACSCPNDKCDRQGICCECVAYHRERGQLPMCLRNLAAKS